MEITERVQKLRNFMKANQIDICVIPTSDYHQSEYVGAHFKLREYLTGFTGSAGTAVFTRTKAGLWTDGRYFIQAAQQLAGTGITLYRMGEPKVESVEEFLEQELCEGGRIGIDGRTVDVDTGCRYKKIAEKKGGKPCI